MNDSYRQFFALQDEPFSADIKRKDIMVTPALSAVQDRVHYTIRLGAVALITGEIGSGKSTALRYVIGDFHPSEYRIIVFCKTFFPKVANFIFPLLGIVTGFAFPSAFKIDPVLPLVFS